MTADDWVKLAPLFAGMITAMYALRSAQLTSRTTAHTAYASPRIEAVTGFLDTLAEFLKDPTEDHQDAVEGARLKITVVAFGDAAAALTMQLMADQIVKELGTIRHGHRHRGRTAIEAAYDALEDRAMAEGGGPYMEAYTIVEGATYQRQQHYRKTGEELDVREDLRALRRLKTQGRLEIDPDILLGVPASHAATHEDARHRYRDARGRALKARETFAEGVAEWLEVEPPRPRRATRYRRRTPWRWWKDRRAAKAQTRAELEGSV
ncbi:hypothetical protein ACGFSI_41750 [Streptomyces virginiae]|uniref:hypothetical protein n=1 Tax=Streptomyces virginiae TaxID=1961 RepID=UPI0037229EF9